jgi:hypothetical protein
MSTPANYATLIAEIDAIVDDFNLSIFQVFGGKPSNLVSLMQLIDLRYKLFEAGGGSAGGGSTQRTPSLTSVTSSGTIPLGARSVSIANIGSAAGTILGTSVDAGMTVNFTAQGSDTLAAIAYNATGTTFLIAEVR